MHAPTSTHLLTLLTLTLTSITNAATSEKFSLLSKSTNELYNNIPFGGVSYVSGTLVGGLQPLQTLPVGGSITDGVLSFIGMDPSDDEIPAYFIVAGEGSWVELDVWGEPQGGYSLDEGGVLLVDGEGAFYACQTTSDDDSISVIGVFYTTAGAAVPSGCYTIQLLADYCDDGHCA